MKIALLAPTGMLGSQVYRALKDKHELTLVYRSSEKLELLERSIGETGRHRKYQFDLMSFYGDYLVGYSDLASSSALKTFVNDIGEVDAVINCAGVIKPLSTKNPDQTLFVNGAVPHVLSSLFKEKLIHITTDCVYDGLSGAPYDENSVKNPNDLYGLSKSIGEPSGSSLVLRTSIVGPEISGFYSLIEWFKKQDGGQTKGFTNHYWNGITTYQFGKLCDQIVSNRAAFAQKGLFHIHSNDVSKYEMLLVFKEKYKLSVEIEPVEHTPVDRRLATVHDLCAQLKVPTFKEMIEEL